MGPMIVHRIKEKDIAEKMKLLKQNEIIGTLQTFFISNMCQYTNKIKYNLLQLNDYQAHIDLYLIRSLNF